ncbi:MAG: hypothetical protein V6Z86_02530 [Hyphomicrobiales bacterium]
MNQTRQPIDAEADIDAVAPNLDALDEELDDAGLLGREQLVPQRIQPFQGFPDLSLGQTIDLGSRRPPCADDHLRGAKEAAQLVDHRALDLGGGHAPDRAGIVAALQNRLADI